LKLPGPLRTHPQRDPRGAARTTEDVIPVPPPARALVAEHLAFVYRVVRRLAGPDDEVEDLVQEVFLVVEKRREAYENRGAATTWLYGICLKVVAGHRRRAWFRALKRGVGLEESEHLAAASDTGASVDRADSERLVYRVLDTMSEKRRTVLVLYELEGLTGEEIAAQLGCPVKTVWTRLFHARREFRTKVEEILGPGVMP
jgi:RNA polymerase sigma-70 factor (ECF subfamily)